MFTFGMSDSNITVDFQGNNVGGIELQVYTDPNGSRVYDLLDYETGSVPMSVVTSIASGPNLGRYGFKIDTDDPNRAVVWMKSSIGLMWPVFAHEALGGVGSVLVQFPTIQSKADQASIDAADAVVTANAANIRSTSAESLANEALAAAGILPFADRLTAPIVIAHRGGALRFPEHSMEGYRASVDQGFVPEADVQSLADGTLVCIHDSTVDRTMIGAAGNVSALTKAEWLAAQLKPAVLGGDYAKPVLFEQMLDELGKRSAINAEIKNPADADAVISAVTARGMQRSVILASFDYATAAKVADAGIASMYLFGSSTAIAASTMVTDGISFVGPSTSVSSATVTSMRSAGLKVIPYTVDTPADYATQVAKNVDGVFSNDPGYITNQFARRSSPDLASRLPWPGMVEGEISTETDHDRVFTFSGVGRGELGVRRLAASRTRSVTCHWAPLVNGNFTITGKFRYGPGANSDTRWHGVFFGTGEGGATYGTAFKDESGHAGENGYTCLFRRDGTLEIFKITDGASTSLATAAGPAIAAGTGATRHMKIQVTTASITVTDLVNGTVATVSDSTYRGDMLVALISNGVEGGISEVSIS